MTVEQYRELPEREDVIQELHWGQVVNLARPKMGHVKLRYRLITLLGPKAESFGVVGSGIGFRALSEYELRAADVAFVSRERWDSADNNDNLYGSPELVIEILSPSNTKGEMREKAALFLSTGAEEFWIVDANRKSVTVMWHQQNALIYEMGDRIPLNLFGGDLAVAEIFEAV